MQKIWKMFFEVDFCTSSSCCTRLILLYRVVPIIHALRRHERYFLVHIRLSSGLMLALLTTGGFAGFPAHAGTKSYNSLAAFQAVSNTTVQATFENFTPVNTIYTSPITEGTVTFMSGPITDSSPNLYVYTPNASSEQHDWGEPLASNVLTEEGNENINMTFSVPTTAVGWDSYTNRFADPTVSVYDTNNILIGMFTLTQASDTQGFFGVISTVPIGRINWLAVNGGTQNTGIDNIRTGAAPVPEASSTVSFGLLLLLGLGGIAVSRCRKAGAVR